MKKTSYEKKLQRLEKITELLRNQQTDLQESIALYEEGLKLYKECKEELDEMDEKLKQIIGESEVDLLIGEDDE
ncbi:exodeoxyribonuclease VII small subunit [Filifactor villosus]|uniref:Exodeoxyribonuclease 7 small subunit n=1 Tax=Filifactor villosus TaxID=29374 RepID=A0ABV9QK45_9FIRM